MTRKGRTLGFTLIELLVVIAIIALLVSILVPSLQSARDLARKAMCGNNMKIVGLGVGFYEKEYNEYIPPARMFAMNLGFKKYWPDLIAPYIDADCKVIDTLKMLSVGVQPESGDYGNYWKKEVYGDDSLDCRCSRKFDCPGIPNKGKKSTQDYEVMAFEMHWNYCFNAKQRAWLYNSDAVAAADPTSWIYRASTNPLQATWFPNAAGFCIVYCNDLQKQAQAFGSGYYYQDYNNVTNGNQGLWLAAGAPHRQTMNMLMMDGHVTSYDSAAMLKWLGPGSPRKEPWELNLKNGDQYFSKFPS